LDNIYHEAQGKKHRGWDGRLDKYSIRQGETTLTQVVVRWRENQRDCIVRLLEWYHEDHLLPLFTFYFM